MSPTTAGGQPGLQWPSWDTKPGEASVTVRGMTEETEKKRSGGHETAGGTDTTEEERGADGNEYVIN